jgi:hypothetical protein
MNPRKAECMGLYLYGSGYFAREDQQLGILRGERTEATFCNECPVKQKCEKEHARRVRAQSPQEVEIFKAEVAKAARRGISSTLVAAARAKAGRPDPYMALALENYHRGIRARADSL